MNIGWAVPTLLGVRLYPSHPRWTSLAGRRTNRLLIENQRLHKRSHARLQRQSWFASTYGRK